MYVIYVIWICVFSGMIHLGFMPPPPINYPHTIRLFGKQLWARVHTQNRVSNVYGCIGFASSKEGE